MPTQTAHAFCLPGRMHRFNPDSGWCEQGCGVRDDGEQHDRHGRVIARAPETTPPMFTNDEQETTA